MKSNRKNRSLVIYTLIVIVLFGAIFAINQAGNTEEDSSEQPLAEAPSIEGQPLAGDENAQVSIVEFGDYKCPSCKAWGEQVWPLLKQDYIDTGLASFSYINTLFHGEESKLAAQASEVIYLDYPEQFWDFHKALFDEQPTQVSHDDLWVTESKVLEVAEATVSDLDADKFMNDLKSSEIQDKLDQDQLQVDKFGIQQTPTIVVNNIVIANPFDYEAIKQAIEQETE
ncbi:DsbA family protein [Paenibacillus sp. 1P07SE]|uniref:DsbA family protein n=1 Tax=Paenibacillus sp. 1P07SE TaxID=3132209 RepID=UPI0039A4BDD1